MKVRNNGKSPVCVKGKWVGPKEIMDVDLTKAEWYSIWRTRLVVVEETSKPVVRRAYKKKEKTVAVEIPKPEEVEEEPPKEGLSDVEAEEADTEEKSIGDKDEVNTNGTSRPLVF